MRRAEHGFDPKNAPPELWRLFGRRLYDGEPVRVLELRGAIGSAAATPAETGAELHAARRSERQGRLICCDEEATVEREEREGYF